MAAYAAAVSWSVLMRGEGYRLAFSRGGDGRRGEIEAAEKGALPPRITAVRGDFHVHTAVSGDGRSDLDEVITAARARGYRVVAITEHAEGTVSGVGREKLLEQRARLRAVQAELGDALFALVNLARHVEVDAESALRRTIEKFSRRFAHVEGRVHEVHGGWPSTDSGEKLTLEELDGYWEEAKRLGVAP